MKTEYKENLPGPPAQSRRSFIQKSAILGAGIPLLGKLSSAYGSSNPFTGGGPSSSPGADDLTINIFSKHLQFLGYDEMAEASAETGVDGVDLSVRPGGHVLPENAGKDLPVAVKAVRSAGLECIMMTSGINDPDDPDTEKVLQLASELGIKYYRFAYFRFDPKLGLEKNLDSIRQKMSRLAVLNEKYKIHGAYQNHSGDRFGSPVWDIWEVIRDLDPRWVGCQYDLRHAIVEGAYSWPMGMELLRNHIHCMAFKDFIWEKKGDKWQIKNVPIGEGMVDFQTYLGLLDKYNISGPISLHVEYPLFEGENLSVADKKTAAIKTIQKDVTAVRAILKS